MVEKLVIFGSLVKDEFGEDSDIDIAAAITDFWQSLAS